MYIGIYICIYVYRSRMRTRCPWLRRPWSNPRMSEVHIHDELVRLLSFGTMFFSFALTFLANHLVQHETLVKGTHCNMHYNTLQHTLQHIKWVRMSKGVGSSRHLYTQTQNLQLQSWAACAHLPPISTRPISTVNLKSINDPMKGNKINNSFVQVACAHLRPVCAN